MTDKTKKALNIASGAAIVAGAAGFILTGGTDAGAGTILSGAIVVVGAVTALVNAIKG